MKGLGTIIIVLAFIVAFLVTIVMPDIPIGRMLYDLLAIPEISDPILGFPTTTLIVAVFNGVFYGIIAWIIFVLAKTLTRPPKPKPEVPH